MDLPCNYTTRHKGLFGPLSRRVDTNEDLRLISDLIEQVPSNGERASRWSEVALRCIRLQEARGVRRESSQSMFARCCRVFLKVMKGIGQG